MFHISASNLSDVALDAPGMAIVRHFIAAGERQQFQNTCEENKHHLVEATKTRRLLGGWREDKEAEGKDEFILFSGWEAVEEHQGFAKTPGFQEYQRIMAHIDGTEIKHAKKYQV